MNLAVRITSPASIACAVLRSAYAETNPHILTIIAAHRRTCPHEGPCEQKAGLSLRREPADDSPGEGPQGFTGYTGVLVPTTGSHFRLHLVSDSSGEALITRSRAVAAQ